MGRVAALAALLWTGLSPALALAQDAGERDVTGPRLPYAWLWIVVAVLVIAALSMLMFRGDGLRPPTPPARKP